MAGKGGVFDQINYLCDHFGKRNFGGKQNNNQRIGLLQIQFLSRLTSKTSVLFTR